MKQNSAGGLILTLLMVFALGALGLFLFQSAWLAVIQYLLSSSQATPFPLSTTPLPTYSFPKTTGPVPPGTEAMAGSVGITVARVIRPADSYMGKAAFPAVALAGKEYLLVDVNVRCLPTAARCRVVEFDFGVETRGGGTYPAELSGDYSDELAGVFEGGDIQPGKSMSGSLFFIIPRGESGLTLIYPRSFGFGDTATFALGR